MMELVSTVRRLMHQVKVVASFCFFIDGLDEYDGDHNDIIQIIDELSRISRIKICLSSRPWNIFEDVFGQGSNQKLALQDLTRGKNNGNLMYSLFLHVLEVIGHVSIASNLKALKLPRGS